jgi:hypothetical protein
MEFIASRGYELPRSFKEMEQGAWINMWTRKLWPYLELNKNDTLYWYETISGCILWKTVVVEVEKLSYNNKDEVLRNLKDKFGPLDENHPYFLNAPNSGYCLAYMVKPLKILSLPKPDGIKFPRMGWFHIDTYISRDWLNK